MKENVANLTPENFRNNLAKLVIDELLSDSRTFLSCPRSGSLNIITQSDNGQYINFGLVDGLKLGYNRLADAPARAFSKCIKPHQESFIRSIKDNCAVNHVKIIISKLFTDEFFVHITRIARRWGKDMTKLKKTELIKIVKRVIQKCSSSLFDDSQFEKEVCGAVLNCCSDSTPLSVVNDSNLKKPSHIFSEIQDLIVCSHSNETLIDTNNVRALLTVYVFFSFLNTERWLKGGHFNKKPVTEASHCTQSVDGRSNDENGSQVVHHGKSNANDFTNPTKKRKYNERYLEMGFTDTNDCQPQYRTFYFVDHFLKFYVMTWKVSLHSTLLSYKEVRWLSRGKTLKRLMELRTEVLSFLMDHNVTLGEIMNNVTRLCQFSYLADNFSKMNEFSLSLQGRTMTTFDASHKVSAFKRKINYWTECTTIGKFECFLIMQAFFEENGEQASTNIVNEIIEHLKQLNNSFEQYFPADREVLLKDHE
ncbi:Hypothetical protein CINCED_3A022688 [Cinara cedri]|uniref:Uncharacterized protein n=1 Tax=Cinara cedri TaxID=506608 RepID=A0A5E4NMQ4_9HEMI|nr:Hypothetical protein CINCED_3A022688 [Cinara cedri]